ncbi:GNAT superfamily N-acetyltransferase [Actinoplanes octamycinicus]|uniref:GNAT superfamily N-acetyltransferase n=1 Tax=Actinoplanes octamycinicus TaxID=135948 RepID=A0A7W7H8I1_9ACTN|nr:GNAT family N-acetyltransferase [Actinoplanes octamycinicus]MBB4745823.1 GNAT superfamily N-acetyltransferase [Actinoplanes octamycinicus]
MTALRVRAAGPDDRATVARLITESWHAPILVVHGVTYHAADLPALLAETGPDGDIAGLLTYHVDGGALEIVSLNAFTSGAGVGSALLDAAAGVARERGLTRLWVVTTNDNLDALRFYQRRGLRLAALAPGAVDAARLVKPSIPLVGDHGIPLRDELTLEMPVA